MRKNSEKKGSYRAQIALGLLFMGFGGPVFAYTYAIGSLQLGVLVILMMIYLAFSVYKANIELAKIEEIEQAENNKELADAILLALAQHRISDKGHNQQKSDEDQRYLDDLI